MTSRSTVPAFTSWVIRALTFCVLIVAAVCSALYELMLSLDLFISEIWWIAGFLSSLGLFAAAMYMMSAVNEEVESRYMLD